MKLLKVLAVGVTVGGMALAIHSENAEAEEQTPRSIEQIKADIVKTDGTEYTIVTGHTLSGIGEATNMTVKALAEKNSIANVDLIYAGNKLVFEGNVVTVQNPQGETIAQSVVKDEDKIDPSQPIGQAPTTGSDTNQGSQAVTPPVTGDSGSVSGGNTVTPPATGDNGSTGGGSTVTPPTGGDNGSNGGGNETTPEQPKPEEPTRVTPLGNSGMEFNTIDEANEWGMAELMNPDSVWKEYTGFVTKPLMWSDGLVRSYSVDFYN